MIPFAAVGVGVLLAAGLYLLLSANLQRVVLGFLLFSNGVNLAVLASTRLPPRAIAPVLGAGPGEPADPLPHAFVLTAIVIGLGAAVFLMALAVRAYRQTGRNEAGGS